MVPAISAAQAAADALRCAGIGLFAALIRCLLPLRGRTACFLADFWCTGLCLVLLQGFAAGESCAGAWRWYLLAGAAAGAAAGEAVFRAVRREIGLLWIRGVCIPLKKQLGRMCRPVEKICRKYAAREKKQKKPQKIKQYPKKRLQKPPDVLYNSNV